MTPEINVQKSDIRAVENPISAMFDLAEDVYQRAPKVRKLIRYARAFIYLWLFIDFLIIVILGNHPAVSFLLLLVVSFSLYSLRWTEKRDPRIALMTVAGFLAFLVILLSFTSVFLVAVLLVVLYYLGWVVLDFLRDMRRFFDFYVVRHKVIRAVREADPSVKIPPGLDPVSRLLTQLSGASSETARVMSIPNSVTRPAPLRGRTGVVHNFDAMVLAPASALWSLTSWAYPGWCILVKSFEGPPKLDDLKYLKHAAEDVCAAQRVPPSRVVALWNMKEGQAVGEDAYKFLTTEVVTYKRRGDTFLCSLEMIAETAEGTYDLIPFIAQVSP